MPPFLILNPGKVGLPPEMLSTNDTAAQRTPKPTVAPQALSEAARMSNDSADSAEALAALGELADVLETTSIGLRFEIDEDTNRIITKVIDKETGDLIRQMPTEEVLRIARAMNKLQGLLVTQKA
ncbi:MULTISPECIES: flagellar protein FlaG [Cupriavidus]|uniref:Flagellar protein FlaG n=1 Tax=Cupriavidus oxalaticus TaxID=96344 RepID=A0A4P7LDT4_9BURK|nr:MULTISPECIES: flagellar protein FlaG [Cupriavidus]MBF6990363.1 flagellar protein FlaG [Cupriavidus sp. IK-TO18]QBY50617.1 flagellar protein FlaG [Cupriavidus oxalaticus]